MYYLIPSCKKIELDRSPDFGIQGPGLKKLSHTYPSPVPETVVVHLYLTRSVFWVCLVDHPHPLEVIFCQYFTITTPPLTTCERKSGEGVCNSFFTYFWSGLLKFLVFSGKIEFTPPPPPRGSAGGKLLLEGLQP